MERKRLSWGVREEAELVKVSTNEAREMMKRVATWSFETLFLPLLPN